MEAGSDGPGRLEGECPPRVPGWTSYDLECVAAHIKPLRFCDAEPVNMTILSWDHPARVTDVASRQRVRGIKRLLQAVVKVKAARDGFDLIDHCGAAEDRVRIWYSGSDQLKQFLCHGGSGTDNRAPHASPCDLLTAAPPDASSGASASAPGVVDAAADDSAHYKVLLAYAIRPFAIATRACCRASLQTIMPDSITAAQAASGDVGSLLEELLALARSAIGIRVTTSNKQIAQDYRHGLRRFVDGILAALRLVIVVVLAALSHLATALTFLLVMLATVRHYGHRGEPDGHFLPALAVQPQRSLGAVCRVT